MMPHALFKTRAYMAAFMALREDRDPQFYQASLRGISARDYLASLAKDARRKARARRADEAKYPLVECGYCGASYRHTPRVKPVCNSCYPR